MTVVDAETGEIVKSSLEACERVIEAGLEAFVEVGTALLTIRDERLYKRAGFKTFETYCQDRWSLERNRATRLIQAAQVVAVLVPNGHQSPANERQARELVPLLDDPASLIDAWSAANAQAETEGKRVSAPIVNKAVVEKTGRRADRSRVAVEEREQRLTELAAAGHTSRQIAAELGLQVEGVRSIAKRIGLAIVADQTMGRAHLLDSNRILRETIHTLEGLTQGVGLIVPTDLDKSLVPEWSESLGESLRDLRALHTLLKGMQSNG